MEMHLVYLTLERAREIGASSYVTGPCKRGHYTQRMVRERSCIVCRRESKKQHMRRKHSDEEYRTRVSRERRERYANDGEYRNRILEQCKQYREENIDNVRNRAREYHQANREERLAYKRDWYCENRDKVFEYQLEYERSNPEKCKAWKSASSRARRHRRPAKMSELDQFVLEECYDLADKRTREFGFEWQVDHMIPLQGKNVSGLHVWRNLQVIPAWLNYSKKNKMIYTKPLEWLADAT